MNSSINWDRLITLLAILLVTAGSYPALLVSDWVKVTWNLIVLLLLIWKYIHE